jgi:hypothetical protein
MRTRVLTWPPLRPLLLLRSTPTAVARWGFFVYKSVSIFVSFNLICSSLQMLDAHCLKSLPVLLQHSVAEVRQAACRLLCACATDATAGPTLDALQCVFH